MTSATMTSGRLRRPPASALVAGLSAALALAGLIITLMTDPAAGVAGHVYEDTFTALVWTVPGYVLATHAAGRRFGLLFLVVAAGAGISVFAGAFALSASGAIATTAAWLSGWSWIAGTFIPITLVPLWFPDGAVGRQRWLGAVSVLGMTIMSLGLATSARVQLSDTRTTPNPLRLPTADTFFLLGATLVVVCAVGSVYVLLRRLRAASGEQRRRLAPVSVAIVVMLTALLVAVVVPRWGPGIQLLTTPLTPLAVTVVVLHYRMYDVELVVRRALIFAGLSVLVVGGYAVLVQAAANLLHRHAGLPESVFATGVVALAFQPARAALQTVVGRWLYGERNDPLRALSDLGRELVVAADPLAAVASAAERIRTALRSPWIGISGPDGTIAESGREPSWAHVPYSLELRHLGVSCGALQVCPRGPREPFSSRDLIMLDQLVNPVAAAVAAHCQVAEIRLSRERAVVAREEERRRVRRDLHDGLGPTLSALNLHLDVLTLRQEATAPDSALLARVRTIADDAVLTLRQVIDDLQPAAIDDLGLAGALDELATSFSAGGVEVVMTTQIPDGLPAAVEIATYRICAEAITNALRHGQASFVRVLVRADPAIVSLEISDDGIGMPPSITPGIGLTSMRERAEELGGRIELQPGPNGTTVRCQLPRRAEQIP